MTCIGFGAAEFVGLAPDVSVVANFEGAINSTTLTCVVTNEGFQIDASWSLANFRGVESRRGLVLIPDQTLFLVGGLFFDELTVTNWTSEVDQVIVFCGTGEQPAQANVTLRTYREF